MKGLAPLGLGVQQVADIAAARDRNGTPGLQRALTLGHAAVVTAFVDGLQCLELSSRQLADIAAAKGTSGRNGLYRAYQNGHADAAKAFIDGVTRLQQQGLITARQMARIVASAERLEPAPHPAAMMEASRHVLRKEPPPQRQHQQWHAASHSSPGFLALCGVALFAGIVRQLIDGTPQFEPATDGPTPVTFHLPGTYPPRR
jgi:hypothetical protein